MERELPKRRLQVENLEVRLAATGEVLLDNVHFWLTEGEIFALVGESGCGKTTLGRAILGLVKTHSGSVTFDGRKTSELSESAFRDLRHNMSMMFQDPIGSLSPRQTVRALITEPFDIHRKGQYDKHEAARRLCDMVNLPHTFLSRYPHELSGGQARRVGVARALALDRGHGAENGREVAVAEHRHEVAREHRP